MAAAPPRPPQPERAGQRSRGRAATLIAYFDTSALIKLLLAEDGSALADELWARATSRVASRLVYPEGRAALAAAQRAGRIDERAHRRSAQDLSSACAAMRLVGVDWQLAMRAGEIAEEHALRGYDAVHLATALSIEDANVALVTWDRDLAHATLRSGRSVAPPPT
jgi:predicted nucleic acid-binding protein